MSVTGAEADRRGSGAGTEHLRPSPILWGVRRFSGEENAISVRRSESRVQLEQGEIDSLARSGSLVLGGFAVGAGLQFALVLVVTHGLAVGSAGALFEGIALVSMVAGALLLGADSGLLRWIPLLSARGRWSDIRPTIAIAVIPVGVAGTLAAVGISSSAPELASLLVSDRQRSAAVLVLRVIAWGIPLASLTTVLLAGTRALGTVTPFVAVQQLLIPGLRLTAVAAAVAIGGSTLGVSLGWLLPLAVGAAAGLAALLSRLPRAVEAPRQKRAELGIRSTAAAFWRFAAPTTFSTIFVSAISSFDVLLVGALASTREAAIYAAASRVIFLGVYVVESLGKALGPRFSQALAHGQVGRAHDLYHVATSWMMALLWPLYTALAMFAPVVMRIFGSGYGSGATALTVLALAELVDVATGNTTLMLLMSGRSGLNLANSSVSFALNLGLDIVLIPRFGLTGAAVAWAACIVAQNAAASIETRILLGLRPFGAGSRLVGMWTAVLFGLGGGFIRWEVGATVSGLALAAVCCGAAYGLMLSLRRETLHLAGLARALRPRLDAGREHEPGVGLQ